MMSYARGTQPEARGGHTAPAPRTLRRAVDWLVLAALRWHELAQQRRRLLTLDDRMLKDIGITRADAMHEGMRPFWDDGRRWP